LYHQTESLKTSCGVLGVSWLALASIVKVPASWATAEAGRNAVKARSIAANHATTPTFATNCLALPTHK